MRKAFCLSLLLLCVVLSAAPARAQMFTGAELLADCQSTGDAVRVYRCLGYVAGVIDYHTFQQSLGTTPTTNFCMPDGITKEEAAIVVIAYLQAHRENDAFIAAPAIAMAMKTVYPCGVPKKRKKR